MGARMRRERPNPKAYRCSFCGKDQREVERLIAGLDGVYICDECVARCSTIIAEERAARAPAPERQLVSSGTVWEGRVGYSRAVRLGNLVFVSGTTATDDEGRLVAPGDAEGQAAYIIEKIGRALVEAGASLADVVRTRVYLTDVNDWEAVGRAHARHFGETRPANTLVGVGALVGDGYLVEIEADAVLPASWPGRRVTAKSEAPS